MLRLLFLCLVAVGCARTTPTAEQLADGGPLPRPVVVIAGYADFLSISSRHLAGELRDATGDGRVLAVPGGFHDDFDAHADDVARRARETFGEGVEYDVIGVSMGGLTARHLAATDRLDVARLFTVCAPHTGAQLADNWAWADFLGNGRQMRPGSGYLAALARAEAGGDIPLVAYAREKDFTIGPGAELPTHLQDRGQLIWLGVPWWRTGHAFCYADDRIVADLARRLLP